MSNTKTAAELLRVVQEHVNAERQKIESKFYPLEFDLLSENYVTDGATRKDGLKGICDEFHFYGEEDIKCLIEKFHGAEDSKSELGMYWAEQKHPKIIYGRLKKKGYYTERDNDGEIYKENLIWVAGWEIDNTKEDYFACDYGIVKFVGWTAAGRNSAYDAAKHLAQKAKEANAKLAELNQLLEYTKSLINVTD